MSFDLVVAVKRDPSGRWQRVDAASPSATCIFVVVNGEFDREASRAVISTIDDLLGQRPESIIVKMENVELTDDSCLTPFARAVMSFRSQGVHAQVAAENARLHARMETCEDARDWLVDPIRSDFDAPRHAVHVDGPGGPIEGNDVLRGRGLESD